MKWEVQIEGDESAIKTLAEYFSDENLSSAYFRRNELGYVLCSQDFLDTDDHRSVKSKAERKLTSITGAVRLLGPHWTFRLSSVYGIDETGKKHTVTFVEGVAVSLEINPYPYELIPLYLQLSEIDENVAKVLRLWERNRLSWTDLYRIYEVIEHDISENYIMSKGWASKSDIKLFRRTANSVAVAGDEARHGKKTGEPPKNPMAKKEGRELIKKIISEWMNEKIK